MSLPAAPPGAAPEAAGLASGGLLRVSINLGNPLLAHRDPATGVPAGVSVDIARHVAAQLGVEPEFLVSEKAAASVAIVAGGGADLGFFAVDPARSGQIAFSSPYLDIDGAYLVRADSPILANADVDRPGTVVVVSRGSAYDHDLTRTLRHATIDRSAGPHDVVARFLASGADVAAGIRASLLEAAAAQPGLRVLDGRFMTIGQALAIPRDKPSAALDWLQRCIDAMARDGALAASLARHGIRGATIAAPRAAGQHRHRHRPMTGRPAHARRRRGARMPAISIAITPICGDTNDPAHPRRRRAQAAAGQGGSERMDRLDARIL